MIFNRYDRRFFTILSIVFVQIAGAALILPLLPLFAERQFQMQPAAITLLIASYFAAQFFAGPYLGQLSDRYGRVPILVISQFGSALSFFLMAVAGNPAMLFVARVVDGITGGNLIVAQAYVTDVTPEEERTEALGKIYAVFGIAFIIGPALGGVLSAWLGPRMPFVIAGGAALVTTAMSWRLEETVERKPAGARESSQLKIQPSEIAANYPLVLILVIALVGQFGLGMLRSVFALYGDAVIFQGYSLEATNLGVGLLLAAVGLGQFVTQTWFLGPLKRRFGDVRLVLMGTTLRALSLSIFAVLATPWFGGLASLLFAVGQGLMMPPLQSLATRTVDKTFRGSVLGFFQSTISLATIISTAIAGAIYAVQPTFPFWIGAVLSVTVVAPGLALLRLSTRGELNWQERITATD